MELRKQVSRRFDEPLPLDDPHAQEDLDSVGRNGVRTVSRAERIRTHRRCVMLAAAVLDGFSCRRSPTPPPGWPRSCTRTART